MLRQADKRKLEEFRAICRQQCDYIQAPVNWSSPWDDEDYVTQTPIMEPPILGIPPSGGPIVKGPPPSTGQPQSSVASPFGHMLPDKMGMGGDPKNNLKNMFPYPEPPGAAGFPGAATPAPDVPIPPVVVPNPPDDPPDIVPPPPPPPPVPASVCPNFHPDHTIPGKMSQADIVRAITAYTNNKGYRHDPDGIPWISQGNWVPWDGVTTINPCTSSKGQLMAFIFPPPGGVNTMRGIRELFYQVNPFADNQNPTVAEIENWNVEVIRHFRKLLGFSQATHPVSNHKCTYLRAAWSEERARSNHWTVAYPGTQDSSAGPCTTPFSPNAHCGGGFILNPGDQVPYLCPNTMAPCTASSGAEGVVNINTDIPWSIKLSRVIGQYLNSDGIGAHTGPFVGREYFGSAWFMNGGTTIARTKWSGNLAPTCP